MGVLVDTPTNWETAANGASPARVWEKNAADDRYWFESDSGDFNDTVEYIGSADLPTTLRFRCEIVEAPATGQVYFYYQNGGSVVATALGATQGSVQYIEVPVDPNETFTFGVDSAGSGVGGFLGNGGIVAVGEALTDYNCTFEIEPECRQLQTLRTEFLTRAGYASTASDPPPGIAAMANAYLADAQSFLYRKYRSLLTLRWFTWQMVAGVRFYDLPDNIDFTETYTPVLDRRSIKAVYCQDENDDWYELAEGIKGYDYTFDPNQSWPTRYEVTRCIEVFPVPQASYKLRIRGRFGLLPFSSDTDYTTIDADPVLWWALGMRATDQGKRDVARDRYSMTRQYIGQIIAGAHHSARYIPGDRGRSRIFRPKMEEFLS